jgi:hypothetical protein
MWDLVTRAYQALATGSALPVSLPDVLAVNRMVDALKPRSVQA